jgi:hypothetical protein
MSTISYPFSVALFRPVMTPSSMRVSGLCFRRGNASRAVDEDFWLHTFFKSLIFGSVSDDRRKMLGESKYIEVVSR